MNKILRILCPTDFSECSEQAVTYAHAIAKASGGVVDCVHVIDSTYLETMLLGGDYVSPRAYTDSFDRVRKDAEDQLEGLVSREHLRGVDMTPHLLEGNVVQEVVALANTIEADILVVSSQGRSGIERLLLGSTCEKIIRTATIPVLALKPREREIVTEGTYQIQVKKILCPMDSSDFSRSALPFATGLAKIYGAKLVLAHVADDRYGHPKCTSKVVLDTGEHLLKSAMGHLQAVAQEISGLEVETRVVAGVPHQKIVELAHTDNIDLIVMPTHGRSGMAHALLGSVTERVVRKAGCPVLTIRPSDEAKESAA